MERAAAAVTMFWCVPKRCTTPHETSVGVARGQHVTRTFLVIRVIFRAVQRTPFSLNLPTLHAQDSDSGLMTRLAGPTIANSPPGPLTRRELDSDLLLSSLKTLIERHCVLLPICRPSRSMVYDLHWPRNGIRETSHCKRTFWKIWLQFGPLHLDRHWTV